MFPVCARNGKDNAGTHSHALTHSLTHSLTHTHHTHITHSHSHSLTVHEHTYIHTNSPTITAPSLLYFLFPSCFSMVSLSLKKLVTCGVIRSFNYFYDFHIWIRQLASPLRVCHGSQAHETDLARPFLNSKVNSELLTACSLPITLPRNMFRHSFICCPWRTAEMIFPILDGLHQAHVQLVRLASSHL